MKNSVATWPKRVAKRGNKKVRETGKPFNQTQVVRTINIIDRRVDMTSIMKIEPLNAENYDTWKLQMEAILVKNDTWSYVDGTKVKPETGDTEIALWKNKDAKAKADIILSISTSELNIIRGCETSREDWLKIESTFQSKGPARKATLLKTD